MSAASTPIPRFSLPAWLPLVAALAVAAAFSRAVLVAALPGPGGSYLLPAGETVAAPAAARARHVRQPRAPDAPESRRTR